MFFVITAEDTANPLSELVSDLRAIFAAPERDQAMGVATSVAKKWQELQKLYDLTRPHTRVPPAYQHVAFCRSFTWSVLSIVYRPPGIISNRCRKYRPLIDSTEFLLFNGCSMPLLTTAVDAVDALRVLSRWFESAPSAAGRTRNLNSACFVLVNLDDGNENSFEV
jgi:hypothetical protein